ncbi:mucin-2-like [Gadus macrocephalus]|uniref:mucin-2-like n=1 Tax=Gadus macrocephalus TaxID=80720 RepID=UPI0028CBBF9E|nr:mucin-2-like [Gadus macrocephalus]
MMLRPCENHCENHMVHPTTSVTVRSSRDFMGFLLQARGAGGPEGGSRLGMSGSWSLTPPGTHTLGCFSPGDSLTHSDKQLKRNLSFVWRAPDHPLGDIQFYITVVQSYFIYWAGIKSPVVHDGNRSFQNSSDTIMSNRSRPLSELLEEEHPVPVFRVKTKASNITGSEMDSRPAATGSPQTDQKTDSYRGSARGITIDSNDLQLLSVMAEQPGVVSLNQYDPTSITFDTLISNNTLKTKTTTPSETIGSPSQTTNTPSQTTNTPSQTTNTPSQTTNTPSQTTNTPSQTIPTPSQTTTTPSQATITSSQTNITTPNQTNITPSQTNITTPSQTNITTPSQTNITTPSQTNITTPSQTTTTPSQTNITIPSQATITSSQTNITTPSQITTTPSQTNISTPNQTNITPSQTNITTPSQTNITTPSQTNTTPSQANITTPNQTNITTPNQTNITTPNQTNITTPNQTNITTPNQTNITTPSQTNTTPSQTNITTPSQTTTTPSQTNITIPSQTNITTPSQTNITTPSQTTTTPSQTNITIPSQTNITTPSQTNITTPSQTNITTPSQTNITTPSPESLPDPDLDPRPDPLKPKPSAPEREGKTPSTKPGNRSWELGMLLGSWAGLGLALVVAVRCVYQHWCGKQTELRLNTREREYERGERGLIHVQECGDLLRVRRIRENSFVLLAEYDVRTPAEL